MEVTVTNPARTGSTATAAELRTYVSAEIPEEPQSDSEDSEHQEGTTTVEGTALRLFCQETILLQVL